MSMNYYSSFDAGLLLAGQEVNDFINTFLEKTDTKDSDPSVTNKDISGYEFVETLFDQETDPITAPYYYDGDETLVALRGHYLNDGDIDEYNTDILFFPAKHMARNGFFCNAYDSEDDVVKEFKDFIGDYLPDDFDYRSHIGLYAFTTWG